MTQLNNKENGQFIRIDKIDINNNRIVYSQYETIIYNEFGQIIKSFKIQPSIGYEFKTIDLQNYLNSSINFEELCYVQLQIELFNTYIVEEGIQNWLYVNKPIRISVNNIKNNKELVSNVSYRNLIFDKLNDNTTIKIVQDTNTIMYVSTILDDDISIISSFINDWIFVEQHLSNEIIELIVS